MEKGKNELYNPHSILSELLLFLVINRQQVLKPAIGIMKRKTSKEVLKKGIMKPGKDQDK